MNTGIPTIAPFWADIDTRGVGNVWYRNTSNDDDALKVKNIVAEAFPQSLDFTASNVIVATWDQVGYYDANDDKVCTITKLL